MYGTMKWKGFLKTLGVPSVPDTRAATRRMHGEYPTISDMSTASKPYAAYFLLLQQEQWTKNISQYTYPLSRCCLYASKTRDKIKRCVKEKIKYLPHNNVVTY